MTRGMILERTVAVNWAMERACTAWRRRAAVPRSVVAFFVMALYFRSSAARAA